ncbi:RING-H2 finger protein ATL2-like [Nicotiana tomentosiformis]|uniref:RING-H2 finger protein ATL2-like n=1 Tax=Nicotiana tomentosiformis TaxID=4098 RepID=UPI00051C9379|nr:RING-H2 finger protein ATL2-like isoform X1 [Nicotiana tomentosiformis]
MDDDDSSTTTALGTLQTCCENPHYAFTGKLMLISVLVFFFVCLLIAFFHLYAIRFFLRRNYARRNATSTITIISSQGLDPLLLKSLPVFIYSAELYNPPLECPVCLSQFENGEAGRVLPKCNHSFHIECIDMWFQSHSNCPICRAPVQPLVSPIEVMENSSEVEREQEVVVMVVESACEKVLACDFSSSELSQSDDGNKPVGNGLEPKEK